MGFFDKVKFWGKKDDFDSLVNSELQNSGLPPTDDLGLGEQAPPLEKSAFDIQDPLTPSSSSFPPPNQDSFGQQQQQQANQPVQQAGPSGRDIELLSSKLDTIKALLNSMDQRIANLEVAAGVGKEKKRERLW